jgi:hypothetical protein
MKIIISQPWGGLGDNLQYSTLPELFHNKGYEVYISSNNKVRNTEIFNLVWGKNPYIKGVSGQPPNAGECNNKYWPPDCKNEYSMHRCELSHNLPRSNFYPKIYYQPNYIIDLSSTILIDLTGSSQVYELNKYVEYINFFLPLLDHNKLIKIIKFEKIKVSSIFDDVYKYLINKINSLGKTIDYIQVTNLEYYCDIINSCDSIIIVNSGINSLASAIKQDKSMPTILCYNPWSNFSAEMIKGCYNYKNVEYFQSKI